MSVPLVIVLSALAASVQTQSTSPAVLEASSSAERIRGTVFFCPERFINPINPTTQGCLPQKIPGSWTTVSDAEWGSYLFTLDHTAVDGNQALYFHQVLSAYRLFIDGVERASVGFPAISAAESQEMTAVQIVDITADSRSSTAVMWISSHSYFRKGLVHSFITGPSTEVHRLRRAQMTSEGILLGLFVFAMLFNAILGGISRFRVASLWVALFCANLALRTLFEGEYLILEFLGPLDWSIRARVVVVTSFAAPALFAHYLNADFANQRLKITAIIGTILALFSALLPFSEMSWYEPSAQIVTLGLTLVMIWEVWLRSYEGNHAARALFIGLIVSFICISSDVSYDLLNNGFLPIRTAAPFGIACLAVGQSVATALRYEEESTKAIGERAAIAMQLESTKTTLTLKSELSEERARLVEEMHDEKIRLFREVSHEIRTPLSLILQPLEQSRDHFKDFPNLEMAYRNTARLKRLIDQLLILESPKPITTPGELRIYAIGDLLTSIYKESSAIFRYFGLDLTYENEIPDDVPGYLSGSSDAMSRVVFHLLSNALKFADDRSEVLLSCSISSSEGQGERCIIRVTNQGALLSQNDTELIFTPFRRSVHQPLRDFPSSGLGLAYSRKTVEDAGGTLLAFSDSHGTHFRIDLPLMAPDDGFIEPEPLQNAHLELLGRFELDQEELEESDFDHQVSRYDQLEKTILLVEDDKDMRTLLSEQLRTAGFLCTVASNGEEALELVRRPGFRPTLILTDWMLPGISGLDFVRKMRGEGLYPDVPIFFVSARSDELSRHEALAAGAVGYLAKPFAFEDLHSQICAVIEHDQALGIVSQEAQSSLISNLATYLSDAFINPLTSIRQTLALVMHDEELKLDSLRDQELFHDEVLAIDRLANFLQTLSRMTEKVASTAHFDPIASIHKVLEGLPATRWNLTYPNNALLNPIAWQGTTALFEFGLSELFHWWIEPQFPTGHRIEVERVEIGQTRMSVTVRGDERRDATPNSLRGYMMVRKLWALANWTLHTSEEHDRITVEFDIGPQVPRNSYPRPLV